MWRCLETILAACLPPISALVQSGAIALPEVNVVAPSPLGGSLVRDKVPATLQTLTSDNFQRTQSSAVTETLFDLWRNPRHRLGPGLFA